MASDFLRALLGALAGGSEAAFGEWQRQGELKRQERDKSEVRTLRMQDRDDRLKREQRSDDQFAVSTAMQMDPETGLTPELSAAFGRLNVPTRREASVRPDFTATPILKGAVVPERATSSTSTSFSPQPSSPSSPFSALSFGGNAPTGEAKRSPLTLPFAVTPHSGEVVDRRPMTADEVKERNVLKSLEAQRDKERPGSPGYNLLNDTILRMGGAPLGARPQKVMFTPEQQALSDSITGVNDSTFDDMSPEQKTQFYQALNQKANAGPSPNFDQGALLTKLGLGADQSKWTKEQAAAYENAVEQRKRELVAAGRDQSGGGITAYQRSNLEGRYSGQLDRMTQDARTAVQQASVAEAGYQQWKSAKAKNSPQGPSSQAMIMSFGKVLDPGSVVRESEYNRSAEMQSWFNKFDAYKNKVMNGGVLADPEIEEMMQAVRAVSKNYKTGQLDYIRRAQEQVKGVGGNFGSVATPDQIAMLAQADAEQALTGKPAGTAVTIDGITYVMLSNGTVVRK